MTVQRVPEVTSPAGRPAWRGLVPGGTTPALPEPLLRFLDGGRPIVMVARTSSVSGVRAVDALLADLRGAVEELEGQSGLAVSGWLPSEAALRERIASTPTQATPVKDRKHPLRHRFVEVDLRADCGVMVLLVTGSGEQRDDDGNQPVAVHIAQLLRRSNAALVAAKRFDRLTRADWAFQPIAHALERTEAFAADEGREPRQFEAVESILAFLRGRESREEARKWARKSRKGQADRSQRVMREGRAAYHIGMPPPAGLAKANLDDGTGGKGQPVLFLDTPACRPAPDEVTFGLPQVFDDHGQPVDQVANVRWLLARLGRPEWGYTRLFRELAKRQYSTTHLRSIHRDPARTYDGDHAKGQEVVRSILGNLELYETGRLTRPLRDDEEPVVITGVMPPDGPWASAEDFARIRRWWAANQEQHERRVELALVGLPARFNGVDVVLLTDHRASRDQPRCYQFARAHDYHQHGRILVPPDHVRIPWQAIHDSLIDAIRDAGGLPVPLAILDDPSDQVADLEADVRCLDHELTVSTTRRDHLDAQLDELDEHGNQVLTGAARKKRVEEYNQLAEQHIPQLQQQLRDAQHAVEHARHPDPDLAEDQQLLELVERLGDPQDTSLRRLWHASLTNLDVTSTPTRVGTARGRHVHWTAVLRFTDDHHTYEIPIQGHWTNGAAAQLSHDLDELVNQHLARLHAGQPLPHPHTTRWRDVKPRLANQLAPNHTNTPLVLNCTDPTLTALATALHLHPDTNDADLAHHHTVTTDLVKRIREIHLHPHPRQHWRQPPTRPLQALYRLAMANDGRVTTAAATEAANVSKGQIWNLLSELRHTTNLWTSHRKHGYQLRPCTCGALNWTLSQIPEPHHAICRTCHHDAAGLHWPTNPYATYDTSPLK